MHSESADVLIVGGGPAGASTAFQLARQGVHVRVLERSRFPRPKPCAECLSPQASRVLSEMGVLAELEPRGALLRGMIVRSPDGTSATGDYAAAHGFRAFRDRGLAIRRELLDDVLLRRAREAGARVDERVRASDVLRDARGTVNGVRTLASNGGTEEVRARIVVGADGLRSVIARRLGVARTAAWPRRISLVAHYRGVRGVSEYGEMHVERDGFVGIADVGDGVTTVAAVFPARRAREISGDRSGFLDRWLASKPHLAGRFAHATRDAHAVAVGPFASHARRAWHPGALLVGDAADFFDPFTGEGMYAALHGGELLAPFLIEALGGARDERVVLAGYDRARKREFGGKWKLERIVGMAIAYPWFLNNAAKVLSRRKDLADLLVGVAGDYIPPRLVLNPRFLFTLFISPAFRP